MEQTKPCFNCGKPVFYKPGGFRKADNQPYSACYRCETKTGGCGKVEWLKGTEPKKETLSQPAYQKPQGTLPSPVSLELEAMNKKIDWIIDSLRTIYPDLQPPL